VFFRANTASDAFQILLNFTRPGDFFFNTNVVYGCFGLLIMFAAEYLREKRHIKLLPFYSTNQIVRNLSYIITIVLIIALGVFDGGQFIYFQF
jgi:heme/copper-type cytochrome/quinol oxidase subunit 2